MDDFFNKNIIISGGCGLLGSQWAKLLCQEGANVIVFDNHTVNTKENLFDAWVYRHIDIEPIDITSEIQVKNMVDYVYKKYLHIDILINAASINPVPKDGEDNSFENYSLEKWNKTIDVNLTGTFLLSRECIGYMLKNEKDGFKGTIVNIASDLGLITPDQSIYENCYIKPPDYCVSKSGVIHLTRYIASYYRDKIKSVCLIPGSVYNGQSETLKRNLEQKIPIGRLAGVKEYDSAIKFLCDVDSDYMQGNCLIMDGGRTII